MTTRLESTAFVVACLVPWLPACVSSSTEEDVDTVRTVVRAHGGTALDLPADLATSPDAAVDDDVQRLVSAPLTAASAVRIALLNNHDLRADLASLGIARGQLVQASLFPNPEVETEVRFSEDPSQPAQWDLGVGVDLTRTILVADRVGIAEAELDAARVRVAGATLDLAYRVRLAFFDAQADAQQLELARHVLDALAASFDATRVLHDAGNATDLDLATEQSAYEGARAAVAEAEVASIESRERLDVLLGLFGRDTAWHIDERLASPATEPPDLTRLETRAIDASLELAELRAILTAASRRVGLAQRAGWLPAVHLGVHAAHDGTYWEAGPAVTARLPIFDRQQGAAIAHRADFDALRERYVARAVEIRAAIRAARARVVSSAERARHYHDTILPLRERVVQQTVLEHNAMQAGVFQLLQARRDQIEAARRYVETLREHWRARAALDQLLAGRLAGTFATSSGGASRPRAEADATHGNH